jgi:hypothetical protein
MHQYVCCIHRDGECWSQQRYVAHEFGIGYFTLRMIGSGERGIGIVPSEEILMEHACLGVIESDLCRSLASRMKTFKESSLTERNFPASIVKGQYRIGTSSAREILFQTKILDCAGDE